MGEVDPYAPPQSTVVEAIPESPNKAGPGRRFLARAADNILVSLVGVGAYLVATGMLHYEQDPEGVLTSICMLIGFAIVFPVQAYFLFHDGQSLAKKLLGLRILRPDGTRASAVRVIFVRELVPAGLTSSIPLIGPLFGLADALFIFGSQTRCIHDYMADTIVVDLREEKEGSLRMGSLRA
jgi:uncharacterized RDD family membrane protein YckC